MSLLSTGRNRGLKTAITVPTRHALPPLSHPPFTRPHSSTSPVSSPRPTPSQPSCPHLPTFSSATPSPHLATHLPRKLTTSAPWLRDACPCPLCVTPSSGQKTFGTFDIPSTIRPQHVHVAANGALHVTWADDIPAFAAAGHTSVYPVEYLEKMRLRRQGGVEDKGDFRTPGRAVGMRLWDREMIGRTVRRIEYKEFISEEGALWEGLLDLEALGLVFLRNVPRDSESVVAIGSRINTLQETFYGRTWDVISKVDAENVAYTAGFLGLHQDMLYVQQPPRIQLLHCMDNSCAGGESLFSDAKHAAEKLIADPSAQAQGAVRLLSDFRVRYHYTTPPFLYRNSWPVLEFRETPDGQRELADVWWSPPFQAPNPPVDAAAAGLGDGEVERRSRQWFEAVQRLRGLIEKEEHVYETKMESGDCVLFDNRRVLHARRAFDTRSGDRWLRGTYIADEDFRSRMQSVPRDVLRMYSERTGLRAMVDDESVKGERSVLEYLTTA